MVDLHQFQTIAEMSAFVMMCVQFIKMGFPKLPAGLVPLVAVGLGILFSYLVAFGLGFLVTPQAAVTPFFQGILVAGSAIGLYQGTLDRWIPAKPPTPPAG